MPVAIGILTIALNVGPGDALAILRARAFADNRCVDDIAHDVIGGVCQPRDLC